MRLGLLPIAVLAALLTSAAPASPASDAQAAERVRAHVEFLASDLMEGRDTGSRGYRIAADYVAAEFRKLGLKPGGTNGSYFLDVPFRRATAAEPARIAITINGRTTSLAIGKDAAVRPSVTERERAMKVPLVFVGHGVRDAKLGIDDYAGLDVRGKIVVALSDQVGGVPSEVAAHLASAQAKIAGDQGAIGLISIDEPTTAAAQLKRFASRPVIDWVDAKGQNSRGSATRALVALSPEWLERLFDRSPKKLRAIRADAAAGKHVRGFPLPATISINAKSNWQDFTSPNVAAVLSGADPKVTREHVVLMAHLDHLGLDKEAKPGADAVYNGVLDNAAGVATMIEAAREFVDSGKPSRRSVLFIANSGEEFGLLGAGYFAAHPTIPADQMVGLVNLDMPLLLYDFTDVVAFGSERSTIRNAVSAAAGSMRIGVSPDPMPRETLFVRSDHYPFVKAGVPSVFLMTGQANGGQKAWQRFLAETYHSVKDDFSQPIRWDAGARFAKLNYLIARNMADARDRPMWYSGDYFGETFAPTQPKAQKKPGR